MTRNLYINTALIVYDNKNPQKITNETPEVRMRVDQRFVPPRNETMVEMYGHFI